MLNLNRQEDLLTQGQPPAERVLANPNQGSAGGAQPEAPPAGAAQGSAQAGALPAAPPDPQLIARRVYDLMRQDLLVLHERSK
jgi:hypothetical protein